VCDFNPEEVLHLLREMVAEALGVFFYVYPGITSQASFFHNGTEPAFGSIFQTGLAYAIGTHALDFVVHFLNGSLFVGNLKLSS
jgi:hypothetical protein